MYVCEFSLAEFVGEGWRVGNSNAVRGMQAEFIDTNTLTAPQKTCKV